MSANTWLIIAIIGFSLSGIALIAAVIMFIRLNIPAIIGDLTGRTVAREIKAMRDTNASSGDKRFRPSAVNLERGTLTEKVAGNTANNMALAHASKRLDKTSGNLSEKGSKRKSGTVGLSDAVQGKSGRVGSEPTDMLNSDSNATEVLSTESTEVLSDNATEVLSDNATEVLDPNATAVLSDGTEVLSSETTVLSPTEQLKTDASKPVAFKIKHDEVVTHSDEVIE